MTWATKGMQLHLMAELTAGRTGTRLDARNKPPIPSVVPAGTGGTVVEANREEFLVEFVWGQHRANRVRYWFRQSMGGGFKEFWEKEKAPPAA